MYYALFIMHYTLCTMHYGVDLRKTKKFGFSEYLPEFLVKSRVSGTHAYPDEFRRSNFRESEKEDLKNKN